MKSKISLFSMTFFKKNIARTWYISAIYFLIVALWMPVSYVLSLTNGYELDVQNGMDSSWLLVNAFTGNYFAIAGFIVAPILTLVIFSYLFSKKDNYMIHSFPVNRETLYVTGVVTAIVEMLVPLFINGAIMKGIAVAYGASAPGVIAYAMLVNAVMDVFFIALASVVMMLTGQIATAVVFIFGINFLYIFMEFTFRLIISMIYFGMESYPSELKANFMTPISMAAQNMCIETNVEWAENSGRILNYDIIFKGQGYLIGYGIAAIVLCALGLFLYKRKQVETVNDFISIPVLEPVFTVLISLVGSTVLAGIVLQLIENSAPMSYNLKYVYLICFMLIFGIVVFYIARMLIEKSFRVFRKKNCIHCIIYCGFVFVLLIFTRFDFMNIENRVPQSTDIEWAGVEFGSTMVFKDESSIEKVMDLHKSILADKSEICEMKYNKDMDDNNYISIKYKLKDGKIVVRAYILDGKVADYNSKYADVTDKFLIIANNPTNIKEHVVAPFYDNCDVTSFTFTRAFLNEDTGYYDKRDAEENFASTAEKMDAYKKVYDALLKDIDEGTVYKTSLLHDNNDDLLFNDFYMTLTTKEQPVYFDEDIFWGYDTDTPNSKEKYIAVSISKNSANTINVLKELGYITDDSQLVTYKEVELLE